ncbi:MAG: hypothetical protein CVU38_10100 [Chloroflexi bacterium HGW-Chloroflexi-1]|nr:MAG: hypothetical protein CVU38_10100 [Chloroflexi bacterium HGW-Chloroflexi-1]
MHVLSGCLVPSDATRSPSKTETIDSPQGDRTLVIDTNTSKDDPTRYLTLVFEVREKKTDRTLHRQQTRASSRMAWSMSWLDHSTVQLRSSDVGTYCWQEQDNGTWIETACP